MGLSFPGRVSKFIAWREFKKRQGGLGKAVNLRLGFNLAVLITLGLGFSISWIWTQNLSFGVLSLIFLPQVFRTLVGYQEYRFKRSLEESALIFFNALLGLIQSGRGLSSSLFDLAQSQSTPFSEKLKKHLKNYQEGRGLSRILVQFRKKTGLPVVGTYLSTLEMAYRQGLEIAPLLEKMIPALEMEQHYRSKIEDLRRQMAAQAALAFCIPWFLAGVLCFFNPELFEALSKKNWTYIIGLIALVIEMGGVWSLWQITRFS